MTSREALLYVIGCIVSYSAGLWVLIWLVGLLFE